jgi:hypothetical protein
VKSPLDRGGLRFWLVALALARGLASHATILAGLPLLAVGAALHFWAKGCLRQNCTVTTSGPYRYVRHPFYFANALIDASLAVMSGWWLLEAALPVWWLAVYLPVMAGEEAHLCRLFGTAYEAYRRQVPQFIPWRRPLPAEGDGFRWSNPNIAADEQIPRTLRLLAYPLLFYVCGELRRSGAAALTDQLTLLAVATMGTLYALAWELKQHLRRRRAILPPFAIHPLAAPVVMGVLAILAAGLLAGGACQPRELFWFTPLVLPLVAAWLLDRRHAAAG